MQVTIKIAHLLTLSNLVRKKARLSNFMGSDSFYFPTAEILISPTALEITMW